MNMKPWMFLVLLTLIGCAVATGFAQDGPATPTTAPRIIPAEDLSAPAPAPPTATATSAAAKPAKPVTRPTSLSRSTLGPGPAVVRSPNLNVRGQAKLNSEVVTQLKRGDLVRVLDEVVLQQPKPKEPARWAKIKLPERTPVWVSSQYVNPDTKKVIPRLLNVRSGPGQNYSILGRMTRGTVINELGRKGD
jgi:uncharacterized protein YgiM (DUF1202 family)